MSTYTRQPSDKDSRNAKADPTYTGGGTAAQIQVDGSSVSTRRAYLYFDISDYTAGSSAINSATLSFYYDTYYGINDPVGRTVQAYKLTRDNWTEAGLSWNNYAVGSAWTTAGGDYVTSSPAGGSAVVPASFGWIDIDITDIVKDAIDNVSSHVNVILKDSLENAGGLYLVDFYAREEATNTTLRPKLVIDYTEGGGAVIPQHNLLMLGVG